MTTHDKDILRKLATRLAEISALPVQEETRRLWHKLNHLEPERTMFMVDELPWHEMNWEDELTLQCEDEVCRELETDLRRQLYRWNHFRDDTVFDPVIYVPYAIEGLHYGLLVQEETTQLDSANTVKAHSYIDQLETEEDLEKLQPCKLTLNEALTQRREGTAREAFEGILDVVMDGPEIYYAPWDRIIEWRGAEQWMYDVIEDPEFIDKLVDKTIDCHLALLDQLEENGWLMHMNRLVHCTGAWTDELPAPGYDPAKPRAKDVWTYGMAQILYMLSPEQHDRFEFSKAHRWYGRFGLGYYGCCEPLEDRFQYVKKIPNIRKISVSAWVKDYPGFAQQLEGKYVYSMKPSPARVAVPSAWNPQETEKELRFYKQCADDAGCPCELTLKDISTVGYRPQSVWEWADIMRKIVLE